MIPEFLDSTSFPGYSCQMYICPVESKLTARANGYCLLIEFIDDFICLPAGCQGWSRLLGLSASETWPPDRIYGLQVRYGQCVHCTVSIVFVDDCSGEYVWTLLYGRCPHQPHCSGSPNAQIPFVFFFQTFSLIFPLRIEINCHGLLQNSYWYILQWSRAKVVENYVHDLLWKPFLPPVDLIFRSNKDWKYMEMRSGEDHCFHAAELIYYTKVKGNAEALLQLDNTRT